MTGRNGVTAPLRAAEPGPDLVSATPRSRALKRRSWRSAGTTNVQVSRTGARGVPVRRSVVTELRKGNVHVTARLLLTISNVMV